MGSNENFNEKPIHKVEVKDFYIGQYEVTNIQYAVFLNARLEADYLLKPNGSILQKVA